MPQWAGEVGGHCAGAGDLTGVSRALFLDLQYCNAATVNSDDWNHYIEFRCKRWWGSLLFGLNPRPVFGAPESKLHKIPARAKIWAISDSQGTIKWPPIHMHLFAATEEFTW